MPDNMQFNPADYSPTLKATTNQGAFRFWCQTVLPLIYDDSLSYYELLNKVVVYLNNVIADMRTTTENVEALDGSFNSLQNYVNTNTHDLIDRYNAVLESFTALQEYVADYFENLDVQDEVNATLDAMAANGRLSELIAPIITPIVNEELAAGIPSAVSDWLDDNVSPVGSAVVVDNTLTISGAAADSKVVGDDLAAIKTNFESLSSGYATTIPNGTDYNTMTTPGTYRVLTNAAAQTMINCPATTSHRFVVIRIASGRFMQICIPISTAGAPEYHRQGTGTTWSNWFRVAYTSDIPENIIVDDTLEIEGVAADAKVTGDRIRNIEANYTTLETSDCIILQANDDYDNLKTPGCYAILSSTVASAVANTPVNVAQRLFVLEIIANRIEQIVYVSAATIPEYRRFFDGTRWTEWRRQAYREDIPEYVETPPIGLHTMPENTGVLNCIKRARQMTDIIWSPAVDIDRVNIVSGQTYDETHNYFQNKFLAGVPYSGLPYSSKNFIGIRKSIESFITSAANPRAKECTDSSYAGNTSVASYFGTVCVSLVSYALHAPQINSPNYTNMPGLTKLFDVYNGSTYHSLNSIKLCDVLWESGHVAIITDIVKGENNNVTAIEVSESTKFGSVVKNNSNDNYGGKCRRKFWNISDFRKWFATFGVYRYDADLLAKIPYYENPYIPIERENSQPAQAALPCIPLEGNKAYYFLSDSTALNVNIAIYEEGYTHLRVKQNGNNYSLIALDGLNDVVVACERNKEAKYEAYLCNMNNDTETTKSASCYWLQLGSTSNKTMHQNEDGSITFSFAKDNDFGEPFVVIFNGTEVNTGNFRVIENLTKTTANNKTTYTFTVMPPSGITVETIAVLTDLHDFGWSPSSAFRPTVV